jgi:hypothetical protein
LVFHFPHISLSLPALASSGLEQLLQASILLL